VTGLVREPVTARVDYTPAVTILTALGAVLRYLAREPRNPMPFGRQVAWVAVVAVFYFLVVLLIDVVLPAVK
jgi:hypothetical protein